MFFVLNKEKIYSYIIAVCTVVILFAVPTIYRKENNSIEVSTNIINENLNTNSVDNVSNSAK